MEPRVRLPRRNDMFIRQVLCFVLAAAVGIPAACGEPADPGIEAIESGLLPPITAKGHKIPRRPITARMKELRVPAVSIAVLRNSTIRWAKAYGLADAAAGRPATPETRFQTASISKPIAAAAALALVHRGLLSLDEDVNTRLTSWKVPINDFTAVSKVTLRRLLCHAAGLSVEGFPGYTPGKPLPALWQILEGAAPANTPAVQPQLQPGLQYHYSGGGYEVVEMLIDDVTHSRFEDVVERYVFKPAGMIHSGYRIPQSDPEWETATGYDGALSPLPGSHYIYPELAAAGVWSTPTDIAQFGGEIQKAATKGSSRLLPRELAVEMLSEQMKPSGLGFELKEGDRKWFGHTGMNAGFQSIALFSTDGDGLVVMTNSDTGFVLAHEIVATLARVYGWSDYYAEERPAIAMKPDVLKQYAGVYPTKRFGTIRVEARRDRLLISTETRPPVEFFPESPRLFFPETPGYKARFAPGFFGGIKSIAFGRLVVARGSALPSSAREER
jgi:CubicO group peptidase (beta-lactamase class C family)